MLLRKNKMLHNIVFEKGNPVEILVDKAPAFANKFLKLMCKAFQIYTYELFKSL